MRDNPALQHIPMAVGGEGMLVIILTIYFIQRIIEPCFSQHRII